MASQPSTSNPSPGGVNIGKPSVRQPSPPAGSGVSKFKITAGPRSCRFATGTTVPDHQSYNSIFFRKFTMKISGTLCKINPGNKLT